ncbi:hypothetical protein [Streptomyces alkaliterrae]|uniref:DUF4267 domain-containing protein n=1 Tax=Streptomyces alkaliterrae TaxID=2213162 RepID=A0A5P0YWZ8_9ACTN|nr:hypothetical protein [Streptomyces alkaliterrae]MBB1255809.1 hypothetical protein [Streptomyces alkaliterrae]MBB1261839.1 hypothetical protein [Streptomyces alkaliterrae]MQS04510.1 hypothetical protein [Streptomyces alkaliterrae]
MDTRLLRIVGAATALYGLAVTARPELLARPSGLTDDRGRVAEHTAVSLRPLGWRDAASGVAMLCAPPGPAMRVAAAVRLAADFGDGVLLAATLPRDRRLKAVAISFGWGALTVAGLARGGTGTGRG